MAEIILKVKPGANYEDGDCLCAFNDKRIRWCHGQRVAHIRKSIGVVNGRAPIDAPSFRLCEVSHRYKFERISATEVRRTNLLTDEEDVFDSSSMDVNEFVSRRIRHKHNNGASKRPMFGSEGAEIWFGGELTPDRAAVDSLWDVIEQQMPNKDRTAIRYRFWPMGRLDIQSHLALVIDDFDDEEAEGLVAPHILMDDDDNPILDDNDEQQVIAKRNIKTPDWRTFAPTDLSTTVEDIEDPNKRIGVEDVDEDGVTYWRVDDQQPVQTDMDRLKNKRRNKTVKKDFIDRQRVRVRGNVRPI